MPPQVPDASGPVAVTVDGATTSVACHDAATLAQDEEAELAAERVAALRNQHSEQVSILILPSDARPRHLLDAKLRACDPDMPRSPHVEAPSAGACHLHRWHAKSMMRSHVPMLAGAMLRTVVLLCDG